MLNSVADRDLGDHRRDVSVAKTLRWLGSLLFALFPSAVMAGPPPRPAQLRPTAYLDGLRGFAAFMVYWHHHQLWVHQSQPGQAEMLEDAWGYQGHYRFATFYGVRTFFTGGHFSVAIFFVISGYVLALKPLQLIQAGDHARLGDALASALFRRWFRLYLPLIVTTFLFLTSWHAFGLWTAVCEPKATYADELWSWYIEFKGFSFLFREGGLPWLTYNGHLWSIPLEMRASVVVYTAMLALSRATPRHRLLCLLCLLVYFFWIVDGYYCALFMAGALLCDLTLLARRDADEGRDGDPDEAEFPAFLRRLASHRRALAYAAFAASMFLSGVPTRTRDMDVLRASPGWYWLSFLKAQAVFDPKWFYLSWAAVLLVAAVPHLPWLRRFFETRFCQHLGRHSFALYLVHGPVLAAAGDRVYHAVGWVRAIERDQERMRAWTNLLPLPRVGPLGLEIAFLLPHVVLLPLTFWVADLVTRAVDEPSVAFAAWLYKKVQGGPDPRPKPEELSLMRLA